MLYPLYFAPNYKDYIWGGRNLAAYGKILPEGIVAESWEVSSHPNGPSIVANGRLAGQSLPQLLASELGIQIMGTLCRDQTEFPLLIKLLDATQANSVQVHPGNAYANKHEQGQNGKNELWYIVHAPEGASLTAGVRTGTDRHSFAEALADGKLEELLQEIPVKSGDVINLPAGVVHALSEGLIIYEIQQNSDLTYRVYDWNRRGGDGQARELHVDKALEVIDFTNAGGRIIFPGLTLPREETDPLRRRLLVANRYFAVSEDQLDGEIPLEADGECFTVLTCLNGQAEIHYTAEDGGLAKVELPQGRTVLIPAALGSYVLAGDKATLLRSELPDFNLLWPQMIAACPPEQLEQRVGLRPFAPEIVNYIG